MTQELSPVDVLVVEDSRSLREEMVEYLRANGLNADGVGNGQGLDARLAGGFPDAIVLDLGLPGEDGIAIARRLRASGTDFGLVMVTARDRVEDRVLGYETGADIYLVKPTDPGELLAAVRATVRHIRRPQAELQGETWRIDLPLRRLIAPSGAAIRLSRAELVALRCLTEAPGQAVPREVIGQRMGKTIELYEHRYVDQVVSRLRRKCQRELDWELPIRASRGQGYFFAERLVRI